MFMENQYWEDMFPLSEYRVDLTSLYEIDSIIIFYYSGGKNASEWKVLIF
jgi:hypothetical protein